MTLFEQPTSYVQDGKPSTGYVSSSDTSKAAHDRNLPRAGSRRLRIFLELERVGWHGLTCDELEVGLAAKHQSVSSALVGMERQGWVRRRVLTRPTRAGNDAHVYVLSSIADRYDDGDLLPQAGTEHVISDADAIRVAEALPYDPECERCTDQHDGEHDVDCALRARDRILRAATAR